MKNHKIFSISSGEWASIDIDGGSSTSQGASLNLISGDSGKLSLGSLPSGEGGISFTAENGTETPIISWQIHEGIPHIRLYGHVSMDHSHIHHLDVQGSMQSPPQPMKLEVLDVKTIRTENLLVLDKFDYPGALSRHVGGHDTDLVVNKDTGEIGIE